MTWKSHGVPSYVRNLSMEATFRSYQDSNQFFYAYVTYDNQKLADPRLDQIRTYNIQASGIIPITETEIVEMELRTNKEDEISSFRVAYHRRFDGNLR